MVNKVQRLGLRQPEELVRKLTAMAISGQQNIQIRIAVDHRIVFCEFAQTANPDLCRDQWNHPEKQKLPACIKRPDRAHDTRHKSKTSDSLCLVLMIREDPVAPQVLAVGRHRAKTDQ